ncbi:MAG: chlorite dismutase family protein [Frankiaceae bacterium]|jgi:chlorite dismutase|nr:chlorite dismutase family protein [Frankiaceae bacterium]
MSPTDDELRALNGVIRYAGWAVYRAERPFAGDAKDLAGRLAAALFGDAPAPAAGTGGDAPTLVLRGAYDVSGLRADADVMFWVHAPSAEQVQSAFRAIRRAAADAGAPLERVWSAVGLHREAEFNKTHVPSFLSGRDPLGWLTVYPFVRSREWYLLPEQERSQMLAEHGRMGREYPQVAANTVSAFALGDYEWILPLEADNLHDLVDLMRHLRASEARRHVLVETPFYTGRRIELAEIGGVLA